MTRCRDLPILGYMITYLDADDEEVILEANTESMATEYTDDTVPAGTMRTYRVRSLTLGNSDKMGEALLELGTSQRTRRATRRWRGSADERDGQRDERHAHRGVVDGSRR